jgi:hypothetical protein
VDPSYRAGTLIWRQLLHAQSDWIRSAKFPLAAEAGLAANGSFVRAAYRKEGSADKVALLYSGCLGTPAAFAPFLLSKARNPWTTQRYWLSSSSSFCFSVVAGGTDGDVGSNPPCSRRTMKQVPLFSIRWLFSWQLATSSFLARS